MRPRWGRRGWTLAPLLAVMGCHAHRTADDTTTVKGPPAQAQVRSDRPVRTTPGGLLDPASVRRIQGALAHHGIPVEETGRLDEATEAALRRFQEREHQPATGLPDYD